MRILMCFLLSFAVSGCVYLTTESLPSQTVNSSYTLSKLEWRNGAKIHLAYKVFEQRGKVGLCGAFAEKGSTNAFGADLNEQAMAAAQVRLAGETLVRGLNFFKRGGFVEGSHPNGAATCVLTDRPWEARFKNTKPRIRWGKTNFTVRG